MPMLRRQPPSGPLAPAPSGVLTRPGGTQLWATHDDFAKFERGADEMMASPPPPPGLSRADQERLVREKIPMALSGLATAAISPDLTAAERGDMARVAATMGVDLTSALEAAQLAPWEKASMQETARLLGGRGSVDFTFDAGQGNDGEAGMRSGTANVRLYPAKFVSPDGVVDIEKLKAVLAHEGRHIFDRRALGLTDDADPRKAFQNLDQYRWSDQNAFRSEAAFNKASGRRDPDGLTEDTADIPLKRL